ncbi:MAG: AAA family ATPase [Planctomycetota bacterium]
MPTPVPRSVTSSGPPDLSHVERLRENVSRVFFGPSHVVDRLLACLLARGHALIEDVPGVGKTLLATALARSLGVSFSRVQLTPDLLPADVLGVSILDRQSGEFRFRTGPIFANVVLADEVNRTTPRTQSALLEAMSERTVSIEGQQHELPQPFLLIATQNPATFEGTYPLPENQLDRFLMRLAVGYPSRDREMQVLAERPSDYALHELEPVLNAAEIDALQRATDAVRLDETLRRYIVELAESTRAHEELAVGASPRATLALAAAARATALLDDRDYCIPEDITDNLVHVWAHRVVGHRFLAGSQAREHEAIVTEIAHRVPSPA